MELINLDVWFVAIQFVLGVVGVLISSLKIATNSVGKVNISPQPDGSLSRPCSRLKGHLNNPMASRLIPSAWHAAALD